MNRTHKSISKPTAPFTALITVVLGFVLFSALEVNSQQLQQGISVNLATTTNAKAAPAADDANAWVVSITADGRLWFGTTPLTPDALANKMIQTPRNRDQNLYIKADARASYSDLVQVLKAAHVVGFESPVLLTAQRASAPPDGVTPPTGFDVWIETGAFAGPKPVQIELAIINGSTVTRVNAQQVSWENLAGTIRQMSTQPETIVRLSAAGEIPFGQVAHAVDAARSAGAKVMLAIPNI
jgi:biopolymer transport protein ExbD